MVPLLPPARGGSSPTALGAPCSRGAPPPRLRGTDPVCVLTPGDAGCLGLWDGPAVPEPPQRHCQEGSAESSGRKSGFPGIPKTVPPAPGRHSDHRAAIPDTPRATAERGPERSGTARNSPERLRPAAPPASAARGTPRPQVLAGPEAAAGPWPG